LRANGEKQRVVVGPQALRIGLAGSSVIKHPAYRDTINICGFDAETDEPAREYIHDQHDPVTAQENGFAAKQIDAPKAVFDVAHEDKPGRAIVTGSTRRTTSLSMSAPKA
jgi:hypothetical protein